MCGKEPGNKDPHVRSSGGSELVQKPITQGGERARCQRPLRGGNKGHVWDKCAAWVPPAIFVTKGLESSRQKMFLVEDSRFNSSTRKTVRAKVKSFPRQKCLRQRQIDSRKTSDLS